MGYPSSNAQNAMDVLDELITSGSLMKVQDETGAAIEPMPLNMGWINNIGNFEPGEGYKVRVASDDVLTIAPSGTGGLKATRPFHAEPVHFKTTWEGNGYDHMNVYLTIDAEDGTKLQPGDEIGVFDGALCVGVTVFQNQHQHQNLLSISVSSDDPTTEVKDGFTPGNTMNFRLFRSADHAEIALGDPEYQAGYSGLFESMGTTVAAIRITAADLHQSVTALGDNYPNPFDQVTIIPYTIGEKSEIEIAVYDVLGQRITTLVHATLEPGSYETTWDGSNNNKESVKPGIYFCRLVAGNKVFVKTIELID